MRPNKLEKYDAEKCCDTGIGITLSSRQIIATVTTDAST